MTPKKTVCIKGEVFAKFSAPEMNMSAFGRTISDKTTRVKLSEMVNNGIIKRTIRTVIQDIENGEFDDTIKTFLEDYNIRSKKSKITNRQAHIAGSFMNSLMKGKITPTIGLVRAGIKNLIISNKKIDIPNDILFCINDELKKSNGFLDEIYADFLIDFENKNKNGVICVMSDYAAISFARYVYTHRNSLNEDFFKNNLASEKTTIKNKSPKSYVKNRELKTTYPCNIDIICDDIDTQPSVEFVSIPSDTQSTNEDFIVDYIDDKERFESLCSDFLCPPLEDETITYYPQESIEDILENQENLQNTLPYSPDVMMVNSSLPITQNSTIDKCNKKFSIPNNNSKQQSIKKYYPKIFDISPPNRYNNSLPTQKKIGLKLTI